MKKFWWKTISLLLTLFVSACVPTAGDELTGTRWELLYINKSSPLPGSKVMLEFQEGELGGSAGCNGYFAAYQFSGQQITISQPGATLMACVDEGMMAQEIAYLTFLPAIKTFFLEGDRLTLVKAAQEQ